MDNPIAISLAECAGLLRISRKHVYHLINTDKAFPQAFKLGRATRVLRSEVVEYAVIKAKRPAGAAVVDEPSQAKSATPRQTTFRRRKS
jgi:predicted DNA-binding transcriptional regulator AlpA